MIVDLMYKNYLNSIVLDDTHLGQFFLGTSEKKDLVEIIGDDCSWIIKSKKNIKIIDDEREVKSVNLKVNNIYKLQIDDDYAFIFCHSLLGRNGNYYKYSVVGNKEISIGRSVENTICFSKDYVSLVHAVLKYHNQYWSIVDNNSTNGIFVNDRKVEKESLEFGDVVYIMGLKIIVGYDFIVINNPDNAVSLTDKELVLEKNDEELMVRDIDDIEIESDEYFYRSPRFKQEIVPVNFKVDGPPSKDVKEKSPLLISLGPSFTMGVASLVTAFFSITNALNNNNLSSVIPTIVMSVSMFIGSIIYPIIIRFYDSRCFIKKEKFKKEKYLKYLESVEKDINNEMKKQENILKDTYVSIDECEDRILNKKRTLWERSYNQSDFLELRLGVGDVLFNHSLQYPEKSFSLVEDELLEKMYELCEKPKLLKNVPVKYSFYENYISGIIGNDSLVKEYIKGLIFQIVSLYGYDEVKLVFLYDNCEFDFVKWVPHTFSDDRKVRYISTNSDELKEVNYHLNNILENRESLNKSDTSDCLPYYVVFNLDKELSLKADFLNRIYKNNSNMNISVINVCSELSELPKECMGVIEVVDDCVKLYDKTTTTEKLSFKSDIKLTANPELLSKKLANINLKYNNDFQLPEICEFMDMYKAGKLEHLNILKRWKENDPTKSLAVPVGIDSYGNNFNLDLHEKFHGPHGLIAGMTGSGKSEFIMTYILSLAINYHPDEVQFLLIDYKGGGMAKTFDGLPHTAGIITNLDDSSMKRALVSINSELKRRQKMFVEVSKKLNISNIDIYKYQKLYREQKVSEPLSHLFIISDEFAELKTQKPEFMNELISAARIGRSLGIHLILATQKPSGIVDDQIWSNSKFKVCLKVQEKSDSMDMLKRADAAFLKETGRFYLQVGYNELFEIGQSAWSGASYYPKEKNSLNFDNSIQIIDNNCRVLKNVSINKFEKVGEITYKQIDAVIRYIKTLASNENIKSRPIWLDEMEEEMLLVDVINKYKISGVNRMKFSPLIGEYDDPKNQLKNYLRLNISDRGNTLVFGSSESGVNEFVNTFIYSAISEYSSVDVNMYLLDFEAETLKAFEKAPHVGSVILASEKEKVTNLIKLLYKEIANRKTMFSEYGGTYNNYVEETKNSIPRIVIVINNYAIYSEMYNDTEEDLIYLTREGSKYGVYFVVVSNVINSVKYRLAQNFGQTVALNFSDDSIYSSIFSKVDVVPKRVLGRGLIKIDNGFFEFQTAKICNEKNIYKYLKGYCEGLSGKRASKVSVLPDIVEAKMMASYVNENFNVPIGLKKSDLGVAYFKLDNKYISLGISQNKEYLSFISELANFIQNNYLDYELMVIDPNNEVLNLNPNIKHIDKKSETVSVIDDLYNLVLERNNKYKEAIQNGMVPDKYSEKIFIINSYADLISNKDSVSIEKMELLLEKGCVDYNIHFIIFDNLKNISMATLKKWYKRHIDSDNGLWFGSGFREQFIFNITGSSLKQELLKNEAVLIVDSNYEVIRVISSGVENNE